MLQVNPTAEPDTIHRIYRLLAQRFHPDNRETGDEARFRAVHEAPDASIPRDAPSTTSITINRSRIACASCRRAPRRKMTSRWSRSTA